jgi:MFS family permease
MDKHVLHFPTPALPAASRTHGLVAGYGLLVLVIASVFSALDRQILVLLAEPMRQALGLSDTRLGLLQGVGITLLAGALAVPFGWLADRYGRRTLLGICLLLWGAGTAACGLAEDFSTLFVGAIGLGIGESGVTPIVYGLIPEIVPERRRGLANGIYTLAAILGAGLGMTLSGALVQALDDARPLLPAGLCTLELWRLAFLATALAGPVLALAVWLIRLQPGHRGDDAPHDTARPALRAYVRAHRRTMVSVFAGSGLLTMGIAAGANWAPIVATREFGATPAEVGEGIGAAYLLGTLAGAMLGAAGVRLLRRRAGLATPVRVITVGATVAGLASLLMPAVPGVAGLYLLFGLQVAALIAGSVLVPTLLQDMTPAALRSRLIAIGTGVTLGLGALSPVVVGALSDLMQANPHGLLFAMAGVGATAFAASAAIMRTAEKPFLHTVNDIHPDLAAKTA